jgi:Tfp pilus assembly protein FimT
MRKIKKYFQTGFTLIELLIAITIQFIMARVSVMNVSGFMVARKLASAN